MVTVNRDSHYTPRMIKRAIIAGLPSAGINVLDMRSVPIPVARYYTRQRGAAGGVHVRLSPFDARVVDIKFFDKRGLDLDKATERKIERLVLPRGLPPRVPGRHRAHRLRERCGARYGSDYLQHLNVEAVQNADEYNRIAVDYANRRRPGAAHAARQAERGRGGDQRGGAGAVALPDAGAVRTRAWSGWEPSPRR